MMIDLRNKLVYKLQNMQFDQLNLTTIRNFITELDRVIQFPQYSDFLYTKYGINIFNDAMDLYLSLTNPMHIGYTLMHNQCY